MQFGGPHEHQSGSEQPILLTEAKWRTKVRLKGQLGKKSEETISDILLVWHPRDASIFRQSDSLLAEEVEGDGQMREPDRQLPARYVLYTHLGLVRGNGGIYDVIKKCQRTSA